MAQLVDTLKKKLHWLAENTQVKSMNIGQSQVPGFQGQELKSFGELMTSTKNQHASQLHIQPADIQKTGKEISVEWESFELTKTAMDHQATLSLLKKYLTMVKSVIGRA